MSFALLKKSLEIVDPETVKSLRKGPKKKVKNICGYNQSGQKLAKGKKAPMLRSSTKPSIVDIRKNIKSKERILGENLKKLKLIKQASLIDLDKETTKQIFERGVTKRPIQAKRIAKKKQKTAFTEEDFEKFEQEYMNE